MTPFEVAFARTIDHEKGLSLDPEDDGNWTGGKRGAGLLKGTKYGISAATYPDEDIANLTLARAAFLYRRDFWNLLELDALPVPLACLVFDAAVNHGPGNALRILQRALGVSADGVIGEVTRRAMQAAVARPELLVMRFIGHRLLFWSDRSKWPSFGKGWTRRGAKELLDAADDFED